jgi:hypothetical protein
MQTGSSACCRISQIGFLADRGGRRRTCTHLPRMATFGRGLLMAINRPAAATPLRCIGAATPRAPAHQRREAGGA